MQNEKNEDHEIWSLVFKRWKNKQILSETGSRFKGPRGLPLPKLPSTAPTPTPHPPGCGREALRYAPLVACD